MKSAHRARYVVIAGALVAALSIGLSLYFRLSVPGQNAPSYQHMEITRLTSSGKASQAAISPDGRYVSHVQFDADGQSLWMRQVATGSNVQIVHPL